MTPAQSSAKHDDVPYRLIALDVDGTLLDGQGGVTPGTKTTLQALVEQEVHVALATGRRNIIANFLPPLLEIPLYMILSNGAVIRDHTGAIAYESYSAQRLGVARGG